MPLYDFEVFATIGAYRNLTQASGDLHLSQPALTQKLRTLETKYNARLYRKTRNGIELTPAGKLLFKYANKILKQHDGLKQKISQVTVTFAAPSLTVGGSYSPSVALLPGLVARFTKAYPNVRLQVTTHNKNEIVRRIESSEVDIALVSNPLPSRFLTVEPYRSEPLIAFVSRTHPLAMKRKLSPEELARIRVVIREGQAPHSSTEQLLKGLKNKGISLVAMRCDSPHAVKEAVKRNLGMGILFQSAVEADIRKGELKKVNLIGLDRAGKTCIVYHKHKPLTPSAKAFLELLHSLRPRSISPPSQLRFGLKQIQILPDTLNKVSPG